MYTQPAEGELRAAYRPSVLSVTSNKKGDVVYCDVYINYKYYRTLVSTSPVLTITPNVPFLGKKYVYQFDIQTVVQEFLTFYMPDIKLTGVVTDNFSTNGDRNGPTGFLTISCMFRGCRTVNGVLVADGTPPVQGTVDSQPVSGTGGVVSNVFRILNAAPPFEADEIFETYLARTCRRYWISAAYKVYTLQTNDKQRVYADDYNFFAIVVNRNGFHTQASTRYLQMVVTIWYNAGSFSNHNLGAQMLYAHDSMYYIPSGIPNLKAMGSLAPFENARSYTVALYDYHQNQYAAISPEYIIIKNANKQKQRLWFQNIWGVMQSLTMEIGTEETEVKSETRIAPFRTPLYSDAWDKRNPSLLRTNISSNERGVLTAVFTESELSYVKECFDAPIAYIEKVLPNGTIDTIPVTILDGTYAIKKIDERYAYEVSIEYQMSNPNVRQNS